MKKLNVLAVMPWYPANAPRWFADAFEQMGHSVFRVGASYFDHYGIQWPKNELPVIDRELPRYAPVWNLDFLIDFAVSKSFTPDLIFLSEENYQTHIMPTARVPVVLWSADGWAQNYARRDMIKSTLSLTNHPMGVVPQRQEKIPKGWKFMTSAAAPWVHKYKGVGRSLDFVLLATMYGKRQQICDGLRAAKFNVLSGQASTLGYVQAYNSALCTYHNSQTQVEVKYRWYEAAMMGCINIADRNPLFSVLGYVPYRDFIPIEDFEPEFDEDNWPSVAAIGRAINFIKENSLRRSGISQDARWLTENDHTYSHRVSQILFDLGLSDDANFIDFDKLLRITYPEWVGE